MPLFCPTSSQCTADTTLLPGSLAGASPRINPVAAALLPDSASTPGCTARSSRPSWTINHIAYTTNVTFWDSPWVDSHGWRIHPEDNLTQYDSVTHRLEIILTHNPSSAEVRCFFDDATSFATESEKLDWLSQFRAGKWLRCRDPDAHSVRPLFEIDTWVSWTPDITVENATYALLKINQTWYCADTESGIP